MTATATVRTYTGRSVEPLALTPDDIALEDIAQGLSNLCRYTGQCNAFYSVAEHSVNVMSLLRARHAPVHAQMAALLHDASEAYLNDIAGPLKHTPDYAFYREAEARAQEAVSKTFNNFVGPFTQESIASADQFMLHVEQHQLMEGGASFSGMPGWYLIHVSWYPPLRCFAPPEAKALFLRWFHALDQERQH